MNNENLLLNSHTSFGIMGVLTHEIFHHRISSEGGNNRGWMANPPPGSGGSVRGRGTGRVFHAQLAQVNANGGEQLLVDAQGRVFQGDL